MEAKKICQFPFPEKEETCRGLFINYAGDSRDQEAEGFSTHNPFNLSIDRYLDRRACRFLSNVNIDQYSIVGIDEAQFFPDLLPTVQDWIERGKRVVVSGLKGDYQKRSFGSILELIPLSDRVEILTAHCIKCIDDSIKRGQSLQFVPAPFTHRKNIQEDETVVIGGIDKYIPVCGRHYELLNKIHLSSSGE